MACEVVAFETKAADSIDWRLGSALCAPKRDAADTNCTAKGGDAEEADSDEAEPVTPGGLRDYGRLRDRYTQAFGDSSTTATPDVTAARRQSRMGL